MIWVNVPGCWSLGEEVFRSLHGGVKQKARAPEETTQVDEGKVSVQLSRRHVGVAAQFCEVKLVQLVAHIFLPTQELLLNLSASAKESFHREGLLLGIWRVGVGADGV